MGTEQNTKIRTGNRTKNQGVRNAWRVALCLVTLAGSLRTTYATFVSGPVSGTWTTSGSPYIATGNLIVSSGQTLTIQPGVTVEMGQGLNMDVEGTISAVGTAAQPVIIRGTSPSLYWDYLLVNYNGGAQSTFFNCNISEATNALQLTITPSGTVAPQVSNCIFSNCVGYCVYGSVGATHIGQTLAGSLVNCMFLASGNGIHLYDWNTGTNNMTVANNLFQGLTGTAMWFDIQGGGGGDLEPKG